jgi:hypothetical protein
LALPCMCGALAQFGRAPALQAGGHRFDPGTLHELPANQHFIVVPMGEFVAELHVCGSG